MIAQTLIALIAVIHIGIVLAEMVFWESGPVRKAFGTSEAYAVNTRALAANMGLYNAFLVAGLIWSLLLGIPGPGTSVAHFFLACVTVAGLYGAATAGRGILFIQAIPGILALVALMAGV
jgi:putative membrane protein